MTTGPSWRNAVLTVAAALAIAVLASACQATTTITSPVSEAAPTPTTAVVDAEPTAEPDATAAPDGDGAASSSKGDDADGHGDARESVEVDLDWVVAFSPDNAYAYEAAGPAWGEEPSCDSPVVPAVHVVDLVESTTESIVAFDAGLELSGRLDTIVFDENGQGIVRALCGAWPDLGVRLTPVRSFDNGTLAATGASFDLDSEPDEQWSWLTGVVAPGVAELEVVFGSDDDRSDWVREIRHIELSSGLTDVVERFDFDPDARYPRAPVASPDGAFAYREIDDPQGGIGCEGFGFAATLEVDDGTSARPVWGADQPVYGTVIGLHFGPNDLVAWTSGCEGYNQAYVGRLLDDGSIIDHHVVEAREFYDRSDVFVEFVAYRLTPNGDLVGLGQRWIDATAPEPFFHRFDLETDPGFVTTGERQPSIDTENPLATTLAGTGEWYLGETLGTTPACGATTLYATTSSGVVRGLGRDVELDRIIGFAASEPRTVEFDDGWSYTSRTLVAVTSCSDDAGGAGDAEVWFAAEGEVPGNGLYFEQAAIDGVTDVLSVREHGDDDGYGFEIVAEVVFGDGTVAEVILEPAPVDS